MEDGVVRPSVYLSEVPNGILSRLSNIKEEVRRRERSVLSLVSSSSSSSGGRKGGQRMRWTVTPAATVAKQKRVSCMLLSSSWLAREQECGVRVLGRLC